MSSCFSAPSVRPSVGTFSPNTAMPPAQRTVPRDLHLLVHVPHHRSIARTSLCNLDPPFPFRKSLVSVGQNFLFFFWRSVLFLSLSDLYSLTTSRNKCHAAGDDHQPCTAA